jgi:hypothetical protein
VFESGGRTAAGKIFEDALRPDVSPAPAHIVFHRASGEVKESPMTNQLKNTILITGVAGFTP